MEATNSSFRTSNAHSEQNQLISSPCFGGMSVRIYGTPDAPLFGANDVTAILGIVNGSDAVSSLDEDEKGVALTDPLSPGGRQTIRCVTESGLYALIFKSRKPEAKAFRKWVTSVVLPSIRRTGQFQADPTLPDVTPLLSLMDKFKECGVSPDISLQVANDYLKEQSRDRRHYDRFAAGFAPQAKKPAKSEAWRSMPVTQNQRNRLEKLGLHVPETAGEASDIYQKFKSEWKALSKKKGRTKLCGPEDEPLMFSLIPEGGVWMIDLRREFEKQKGVSSSVAYYFIRQLINAGKLISKSAGPGYGNRKIVTKGAKPANH